MGILRDYHCDKHGIFEAWEAQCPMKNCNGELSVVHLKPVGTKSSKTKSTDQNLKNLSLDFGMNDIKSTKEGEHQEGYLKRNNKLTDKEFAQAGEAMAATTQQKNKHNGVIWGGGGNISMKSVMGGQFKSVNGESVGINPKQAGNLTGPKAASYIGDHENLQVKK